MIATESDVYSQPSQVPMVVRMHIQRVQFINHLDMLKGRVKRADAEKAAQITTISYSGC